MANRRLQCRQVFWRSGRSTASEPAGRAPTGQRARTVAQQQRPARSVGARGGHEGPASTPGPHPTFESAPTVPERAPPLRTPTARSPSAQAHAPTTIRPAVAGRLTAPRVVASSPFRCRSRARLRAPQTSAHGRSLRLVSYFFRRRPEPNRVQIPSGVRERRQGNRLWRGGAPAMRRRLGRVLLAAVSGSFVVARRVVSCRRALSPPLLVRRSFRLPTDSGVALSGAGPCPSILLSGSVRSSGRREGTSICLVCTLSARIGPSVGVHTFPSLAYMPFRPSRRENQQLSDPFGGSLRYFGLPVMGSPWGPKTWCAHFPSTWAIWPGTPDFRSGELVS